MYRGRMLSALLSALLPLLLLMALVTAVAAHAAHLLLVQSIIVARTVASSSPPSMPSEAQIVSGHDAVGTAVAAASAGSR